ncbi:MAG: hypothetical protein AAFR35_04705 [Pseudomonadota bacterium]
MTRAVMFYRFYRLRRLLVAVVVPPALVVLIIAALKGPAAFALLPLALGIPVWHAVRYPTSWLESVAISVTLAIVLAISGTIGPDVGLIGLMLRLVGLGILAFGLFLGLSLVLSDLLVRGPEQEITARATRRSSLDPETLKARITLYPGRADDMVICGSPDGDGMFPITLKHRMSVLSDEDTTLDAAYADDPTVTVGGPEDPGMFDINLFGVVITSDATTHEVMSIEDGGDVPSVTRYLFKPLKRGTRVTIEERGAPMSLGMRIGFWLQDYIADYLTDEVDRAEGREKRANRFQVQDQFLVDLAGLFVRRRGGHTPAE